MSLSENHIPQKSASSTHPHVVRMRENGITLFNTAEASRWLDTHNINYMVSWYYKPQDVYTEFAFKSEADAVAFSLMWS